MNGVSTGSQVINVNNFTFDNKADNNFNENQTDLAAYIDTAMTFCPGGCGTQVAAYLWSMRTVNETVETNFEDFVTNTSRGEQIFATTCMDSGCHGTAGTSPNAISWARYMSASDFHDYIEPAMPRPPTRDPRDCVGQCAADVSAYLWSLRPVEVSCTIDDGPLFAKRALPLLNPEEYKNSIRDLFLFISTNAQVPEAYLVAPDANYVGSFPHTLRSQVSEDGSAKRLFDNAVAIADWNAMAGNQFVRCSSSDKQTCANEFINGFARMAFRRPLKTTAEAGAQYSEVEHFRRIFSQAPTIADGLKWAIVGALNAPQFIYRSELGIPVPEAVGTSLFNAPSGGAESDFGDHLAALAEDSSAYVLDPYEYASVLSYMITGSTPDPELLQAAQNGDLNSRVGVDRQIDRLFETPRAERHMKAFVSYWMQTKHLSKNAALGELDPNVDLRELMVAELQEFFWHIVDDPSVPFSDFYNADYTFLNKRLADHYGISWNGGNQNEFVRTPLSAQSKRGGITTMGAFLAAHAHNDGSAPILRGVHVREDLLCHHIVPPGSIDEPEGVREEKQRAAEEAAANGGLTTRRYFEIATSSDAAAPLTGCGQCHYYDINPVGAALEDFDGFGRFRTEQIPEGGNANAPRIAIDATAGSANNPGEGIRGLENFQDYSQISDPVNGAKELALLLGKTQAVQSCMVEKAFRSVLSRPIAHAAIDLINRDVDLPLNSYEGESFACASEKLRGEFNASGQDVKALFKELGNLSLLRFRRP